MTRAGDRQVTIDTLRARIESLSPMAVQFVSRLIDSLSSPPRAEITNTWITDTPEWVEYFGLTIAVHHSNAIEPLGLTSFEVAFRNACEALGWRVDVSESPTRRFVDVTVCIDDGQEKKLSLKSTAAQRMSATTAHISKLTEAAWIQDARSAKIRRTRTLELFDQYQKAVDSIVMLRAFRVGRHVLPSKYQLLEIPTAIFSSLENAPQEAFAADGPTIDCTYRGEPVAARVSLDRSDAKITVKQIKLSACTVHAEWYASQRST